MFLSIVIPSIGRDTLENTINSVNQEVKNNIETSNFSVFLNSEKGQLNEVRIENFSNFKLGFSERLLPPWNSMREALSFSRSEYTWLLGDDDLINPGAINKIHKKANYLKPNLIILDGNYDDYKGKIEDLVPSLEDKLFEISDPSELLDFLAQDLHLLNNGRFIVDRDLLEIWLQQPGTEIETFHEEYRALFLAAAELLSKNGSFKILTMRDKIVTLGNVPKSWKKNHDYAVLGEVVMLQSLPLIFGRTREELSKKHLKYRTRLRYLLAIRLAVRGPIRIHPNLKINKYRKMKIYLVNIAPLLKTYSLVRRYRKLKETYSSGN
jgi:hypothetical protein